MASSSSLELLSASLKEKARKELHEREELIDAHLESFERWVKSLPHITFPCEPDLLIPFLRHAKFIHSKAQKRLDNFCTLRTSELQGAPKWFDYPPLGDPQLEAYLKSGLMVELGKTKNDVVFFLNRLNDWNMDAYDLFRMRQFTLMEMDRILLRPECQIAGVGFFADFSGVNTRELMARTSTKDMKLETKVMQDGYPLRFKHLIYYKEPKMVDALFKLAEAWLSEKIRGRILRVKDNLKKAFDKVPGLLEIMPAEYGGGNLPMERLIENHAKSFREFYSKPSPWKNIRVDESKRPNSARNLMREYKDLDFGSLGTEGTYIQLDPGD